MATVDTPELGFSLLNIDTLEFQYHKTPPETDKKLENIVFSLQVEHKLDNVNNRLHVYTSIFIFNNDKMEVELGRVKTLCVYELKNVDAKQPLALSDEFIITINSISISTSRGIMYQLFKGTFLDNALLPIVDPGLMQAIPSKPEEKKVV